MTDKIKDSEKAVSRNRGEKVKYIKRVQEDKESNEYLKEFLERTEEHFRDEDGDDYRGCCEGW